MSAAVPISARLLRLAVFGAAVVGAIAGLGALWFHLTSDPLADVRAYHDAAVRLDAGLPLNPPGADTNLADFYRYPPLLAIVLRPFASLPYAVFAAGWETLIVAAFVATVVGLLRGASAAARARTWLAVGILGFPIAWAVSIGQAHVLVTLLLTIGRPWSIALAANLKLTPALAALWWLGRGDRRPVLRFLAWLAGLVAIQVVLEPTGSVAYLGAAGFGQVGDVRNISPFAVSPWLWAGLVTLGAVVVVRLAPTRWGWPAAATLAALATPRLLVYMLMGLLAGVREPGRTVDPDGDRR